MCVSTCGSSLAHKQKPSSCPSNKRTETYLMATVVLHGAVVNVVPAADCEFSAYQNVHICTLPASAWSHTCQVHCAFLCERMKMRVTMHNRSFSSSAKSARTEAWIAGTDYETAASQTATDTSGWVNGLSPFQWICLWLSQCPFDLSERGLPAASVQQQLRCSPEPGI